MLVRERKYAQKDDRHTTVQGGRDAAAAAAVSCAGGGQTCIIVAGAIVVLPADLVWVPTNQAGNAVLAKRALLVSEVGSGNTSTVGTLLKFYKAQKRYL